MFITWIPILVSFMQFSLFQTPRVWKTSGSFVKQSCGRKIMLETSHFMIHHRSAETGITEPWLSVSPHHLHILDSDIQYGWRDPAGEIGRLDGQTLQWRHNERDGVSNHQPDDCLLNRLSRHRSKKISKLCVTGLCEGNSPATAGFPPQRATNAENVSIWWRHHARSKPRWTLQKTGIQQDILAGWNENCSDTG